jgi:hypothetical protein
LPPSCQIGRKYTAWRESDTKVPSPILTDMDSGYTMTPDLAF